MCTNDISFLDFKSDIAHKVLTENISTLVKTDIQLEYLANKMLEKRIINDDEKREVIDTRTGLSTDQRRDLLVDKLRATVKSDGSVFGWFIQVLKDYNTVLSVNTADKLMVRYDELNQQSCRYTDNLHV